MINRSNELINRSNTDELDCKSRKITSSYHAPTLTATPGYCSRDTKATSLGHLWMSMKMKSAVAWSIIGSNVNIECKSRKTSSFHTVPTCTETAWCSCSRDPKATSMRLLWTYMWSIGPVGARVNFKCKSRNIYSS